MFDHPDLNPNLNKNAGETGGGKETNGLDDDGNGREDGEHESPARVLGLAQFGRR